MPEGIHKVPVTITGNDNEKIVVQTVINNLKLTTEDLNYCFVETNGYISIEAENFSTAVAKSPVSWMTIPNLGRAGSAVTLMPVTAKDISPKENGTRLEYDIYLFNEGEVNVKFYLSPTLNFGYTEGLRFAVSIDDASQLQVEDEEPQIINMHKGDSQDWKYPQFWNQAVSNNIRIAESKHKISKPGKHVLKFWAIDAGVVLQKIVIESGETKPSYLGPPDSMKYTFSNQ